MDLFIPLLLFTLTMSFTPGPNNVMLTASGATFGLRRTVPHMMGVVFGFTFMMVALGLGVGTVITTYPVIHTALKWIGAAYLLWLAWHIATADRAKAATGRARPLSFLEAAAFQWVNPKAWIMGLGAIASFTTVDGDMGLQIAVIAVAFILSGIGSTTTWAAFGVLIGRWLSDDRRLRLFNLVMAALLVLSLIPTLA